MYSVIMMISFTFDIILSPAPGIQSLLLLLGMENT